MTTTTTRVLAAALLAALLASCQAEPEGAPAAPAAPEAQPAPATLSLELAARDATAAAVDLLYHRAPGAAGPRVGEILLAPAGDLELLSAEALGAAADAEKRVVAQQRDDGTLRVVFFSTSSLDGLETGPLARLRFKVGGGAASLALLPHDPIFAPAVANEGVTLGAPLEL